MARRRSREVGWLIFSTFMFENTAITGFQVAWLLLMAFWGFRLSKQVP